MYHKPLVTHVTTKLSEGNSKEKIIAELVADGWTQDDIEEAFYYSANPQKLRYFSLTRALHSEVPSAVIILLSGLGIIFLGIAFILFKQPTLNYQIALPTVPEAHRIAFTYGEQSELSNPDFFGKVKKQFVDDKADFIEANLTTKIIHVYKDGALSLEVPIDTEGREGSWWETPAGLYKITTKEKAHFSTMGHVYMPWSMNFQGNFFIHGRNYYPDGSLTSKQYTGGCIRLSTEDAKKVYDLITIGTPVLVFKQSFATDTFTYKHETGPTLTAPIYLMADLHNNYVFTDKSSTQVVPIASITKLMTALIATEYINLDSIATVPKDAIVFTSKARLKIGDRYSVYQLLFPLLMESSNEAAETISRYYGQTEFVRHMNEKAVSIGMTSTHFKDASGASADNTSTAEDLFMLAKYIYSNRSFIFNITSSKLKENAYGSSGFTNLRNFNDFVGQPYFFGGKNGKTTAAGETNLSVFEFPVGTTTRPVVLLVLGSIDAAKDSRTLLEFGKGVLR